MVAGKFCGVVENNSGFSRIGGEEKETAHLGNFSKEFCWKEDQRKLGSIYREM